MRRERALRYSAEIARRVQEVAGVVATPFGSHEGILIKKMWVFGSTAKGSECPNDLDLLIDYEVYGQRQRWEVVGCDKDYLRRYGIHQAKPSINEALKWLTRGMRNVSRHTTASEATQFDVKVLIYPKYEMPSS